ncbi:hypothetical protein SAMN05216275_106300 [Streptosporangium canum]|uniref:Cell division protein FtsL n=1 Tax=Streptosporangium canum TaxID=324952 RepID=A0A1I3NS20_9ACTN|nr:hypothetical protein [Streptosporangium canum]SFJ11536.1 hypothetical protein SAMN05216275_106300 [Streptosporangium canum]
MRQLTRSESVVRTAPSRGGRPVRAPRATPQVRRTKPVRTAPVADPAAASAASAARPGRAPRAPFMLLVIGLLCGGLVSLLLLNTVLAQDSYKVNELRSANDQLRQKKEELKNANMRLEMPGALSDSSAKQGQGPDWDEANVITDRSAGSRAASDGQTPAGQERVPGTGR